MSRQLNVYKNTRVGRFISIIQLNNSNIFPTFTPHFQPPTRKPLSTNINMSANPGNVVGGHKANLNNPSTYSSSSF